MSTTRRANETPGQRDVRLTTQWLQTNEYHLRSLTTSPDWLDVQLFENDKGERVARVMESGRSKLYRMQPMTLVE